MITKLIIDIFGKSKGYLFFLTSTLFAVTSFSQDLYLSSKSSDLRRMTIKIATVVRTTETKILQIGTSFIIKDRNRYFLATNYHIMAGRSMHDTTLTDDKSGLIPSLALLHFYTKTGDIKHSVVKLLDESGRRLFYTPRPDIRRFVVDLAFLPLTAADLPKDAVIDPVEFAQCDTNWVINPKSILEVYGFREDTSGSVKIAYKDTVRSIANYPISFNSNYIFCYRPFSLNGCSGGPVYYDDNGKKILIGMVSSSLPKEVASQALFERYELFVEPNIAISQFIGFGALRNEFYKIFGR